MSMLRNFVMGSGVVLALAACEKASSPPPEAATAPFETSAPPPSAQSPVVETTPSTGAPEPGPTAASAPVVPPAEPAPSASAPATGTASTSGAESAHHAGSPPKAHAEAPAATTMAPAGEGPTPDDACQTKNFHYTQVASACKSGGRKAAKAVMKGVVKKAKAAGTDLQCTSCHEDTKDFHLKANAVGDLKNWL
jgi:hypothetical protein